RIWARRSAVPMPTAQTILVPPASMPPYNIHAAYILSPSLIEVSCRESRARTVLCVAILIEVLVRRSGCKLSLPYYRSLGAGSAIPVQSCRDLLVLQL